MSDNLGPKTTADSQRQEAITVSIAEFRKTIWTSRDLAQEIDEFLEALENDIGAIEDRENPNSKLIAELESVRQNHEEDIKDAREEGASEVETKMAGTIADLLEEILERQPDATLRPALERFSELLQWNGLETAKSLVFCLVPSSCNHSNAVTV